MSQDIKARLWWRSDKLSEEAADHIEALEQHPAEAKRDAARLDQLERMANLPGGLLLHDGRESGRCGLGLRPGGLVRTLREAIDASQESVEGK